MSTQNCVVVGTGVSFYWADCPVITALPCILFALCSPLWICSLMYTLYYIMVLCSIIMYLEERCFISPYTCCTNLLDQQCDHVSHVAFIILSQNQMQFIASQNEKITSLLVFFFLFLKNHSLTYFHPRTSFLTTCLVLEHKLYTMDRRFISRWTSMAKYFPFYMEVYVSLGVKDHMCFSEMCHAIKQTRVKQKSGTSLKPMFITALVFTSSFHL